MPDTRPARVAGLLLTLEQHLRQAGQWEHEPPPAPALASHQPFSCDTLHLSQWLQWVFLPRMKELVEHDRPLPGKCEILPYAQEQWRGAGYPFTELLQTIARLDLLLSGDPPAP